MSAPVIPKEIAELFESGVSLLIGTRDAKLVPEATRGCGAVVHACRTQLTVFIPDTAGRIALANLKDNGKIAVNFSSVLDHKALQVKGKLVDTRPAREDEREILLRYHAAFTEVLYLVGIPRSVTRLLDDWPCTAVTFEVTDIFHQTPGPGAGERLKT